MKKYLLLVLICLAFQYSTAQINELPLEQFLDGGESQKIKTLKDITDNNLTEYIPAIEERVFSQETLFLQWLFLEALQILDSPNAKELINHFIDQVDGFKSTRIEDPLEYKAFAAILLLEPNIQDYSRSELIIEYFENTTANYNARIFTKLNDVYQNVPNLDQRIITILLNSFNSGGDPLSHYSLIMLNEFNYSGIIQICLNSGINSQDEWIRNYCYAILQDRNYSELKDLLKDNMSTESSGRIRYRHLGNLVKSFGQPSDIKFCIEYLPNEQDLEIKQMMEFSLKDFIPTNPNLPIPQMIDSLNSYTDQLYQYGWIKNEDDYESYKEKTKNLRELFEQKKTDELCSNLNWIISQAESHHGSDLLTEEGYKFLFYYTGYIKEKIETEFGVCK
ncbi:MAG: hypothetical protein IPM56_05245 [Ignavibacteriales bacterium]|nr:MAG: hypothetical protein IPM56_05245 [Ignavibacteriales bacterium]